jgi:hypothetical protein
VADIVSLENPSVLAKKNGTVPFSAELLRTGLVLGMVALLGTVVVMGFAMGAGTTSC